MVTKGAENFGAQRASCHTCNNDDLALLTLSWIVLEGANPSAEGEDAEEGGEAEAVKVLDIEDQFRLNKLESKPSKKAFQGEIKST